MSGSGGSVSAPARAVNRKFPPRRVEKCPAPADTDGVRMRLPFVFVLTTAVAAAVPGCLWSPKPYANDPFVRQRKAVLGDPNRPARLPSHDEPQPPAFPEAPAP